MQEVLQNINSLMETLDSLLPLNPDDQYRLDKKFRLEFNYNSNHLEGNTLTYGETELLLIFDKTTGNHELREYEEMKAHDLAFELIKELAADSERPLSEAGIKNLQQKLLVRSFWKHAITHDGQPTQKLIAVGDYKKSSNHVRLQNGEMFYYASVEDTPVLMGELIHWYKEEEQKAELHPVVLSALLHYRFVKIHPFDDGNGRLARLLMNYVLVNHGLPPVIIKSGDKRNYLFALNQADTGDVNAFITYIAMETVSSLELAIKAARGEAIEEKDDWEKELSLLKRHNKAKPAYSPALAIQTRDEIFIPFLEKLVNKLSGFDDFFYVNEFFAGTLEKLNKINDVADIKKIQLASEQHQTESIVFRKHSDEIKDFSGVRGFLIEIILRFHLLQWEMKIGTEVATLKEYYGTKPAIEIEENAISKIAKQLLQIVKAKHT